MTEYFEVFRMNGVSTENKEGLANLVVALSEWIRKTPNARVELTFILKESNDEKVKV